jgi:multidrug efflux system outer membrane protein
MPAVVPVSNTVPSAGDRADVRQAQQLFEASRQQLRAAQSARFPNVQATGSFLELAYPSSFFPTGNLVSNWTVGVSLDVPLFTAGRISAQIASARASVEQSQLRRTQTEELVALDTADALLQRDSARASWEATSGTVDQAAEAFRIAQVRFREGLSAQIELNDAQLLLQQARATRARADRDLRLAELRVRLLPDLPLSAGSSFAVTAGSTTSPSTTGTSGTTNVQSFSNTTGISGTTTTGVSTTGATGLTGIVR